MSCPVLPYCYQPLSPGPSSRRLLCLLPHEDKDSTIRCRLFNFNLEGPTKSIHPYDALSYVWGGSDKPKCISIDGLHLPVTIQLHEVLLHLRHHLIERVLWVDAVCINQNDDKEKEQQIQFMPEIYSQANCVLVWLGEEANDSNLALEELRIAARMRSARLSSDETVRRAVVKLLQRQWFRRIWVLQEVAAARHIRILCGHLEIDGYVFCMGVESFQAFYTVHEGLWSLVRSVIYLIRGAIFRPSSGDSGRTSGDICPLGELVDMYYSREATKRHDKLYALLGMSSDDLSEANLSPNYSVPWEELLQRLVKFLVGKEIPVETRSDREIAILQGKGCILGSVSSIQNKTGEDDRQGINITWRSLPGYSESDEEPMPTFWTLQASVNPVQEGDIICFLQGASKPAIIRVHKDYATIIIIAALPPEITQTMGLTFKWQNYLQFAARTTREFALVWDWENATQEWKLDDQREFASWRQLQNWQEENVEMELENDTDKATRRWNCGLILGDVQGATAAKRLREALEAYDAALREEDQRALRYERGPSGPSLSARSRYNPVANLLQSKISADQGVLDQISWTPLLAAAGGGYDAVVKVLLETYMRDKDSAGMLDVMSALGMAAGEGHLGVVKLLLSEIPELITPEMKDRIGRALVSAASGGHLAVVECLSPRNTDSIYRESAIRNAAAYGHLDVIKFLRQETVEDNIYIERYFRRMILQTAAGGGHIHIVNWILQDKVEIYETAMGQSGRTALEAAAAGGYLDVVERLLQKDVNIKAGFGVDNRRAALRLATKGGHLAVVECLRRAEVDS